MTLEKNRILKTTNPDVDIIVRATPADSEGEVEKIYFIVDVVTRAGIGSAAYKTEMKVFDTTELRKILGLKRKENMMW